MRACAISRVKNAPNALRYASCPATRLVRLNSSTAASLGGADSSTAASLGADSPIAASCPTVESPRISGEGALALVFAGFGFNQRQLSKHTSLYEDYGFEVIPVMKSITHMITPVHAQRNGKEIADRLMKANKDVVVHGISGSTWTMFYTLHYLDAEWRERHVRAIMFDSCPPQADIYAFGGWLAWFLQAKFGIPAKHTKPYLSQLFRPVRPFFGIVDDGPGTVVYELQQMMTGSTQCVVPRGAACLFLRGANDPVLNPVYVDAMVDFLRARTRSRVEMRLFHKSQHAMAIVNEPDTYKRVHVQDLLACVPEWRV